MPQDDEIVDFGERTVQSNDVVEKINYVFPSIDLLDVQNSNNDINEGELKASADRLRSKIIELNLNIDSITITPGPLITLYELLPGRGVRISEISILRDEIQFALRTTNIRIVPMTEKGTIGIEVRNSNPSDLKIRNLIISNSFRASGIPLPIAIGRTNIGKVYIEDLSKIGYLFISGPTGSGKSVCIHSIIASILYRLPPSDVKLVLIDSRKIELVLYKELRHHYLAVSPDIDEEVVTEPNNAVLLLKSVEAEMEGRNKRIASACVRDITDYNEHLRSGRLQDTKDVKHYKMPYIVVVIDEIASLVERAANEICEPINNLIRSGKSVGICLVISSQHYSNQVIQSMTKSFSKIAYKVASKIDSEAILNIDGAEQLAGNGDMLYLPSGTNNLIRLQSPFISSNEIERIVESIKNQKGYSQPFKLPSALQKYPIFDMRDGEKDELFEEAARILVRHQQGSVSLLQRQLKVGYSRAARLIDELEAAGIVCPFDGSKAREVLIETEEELESVLLGNTVSRNNNIQNQSVTTQSTQGREPSDLRLDCPYCHIKGHVKIKYKRFLLPFQDPDPSIIDWFLAIGTCGIWFLFMLLMGCPYTEKRKVAYCQKCGQSFPLR